MIPDGGALSDQPTQADLPASQAVIGRYPAVGFARWYPTAFAVAFLLLGILQFVLRHRWSGLAYAAAWVALAATVLIRPRFVISDQGVRIGFRRIIPWSQVVEVVSPPNNGWKQQPPELVLLDGHRKPLPELPASKVDGLRSLARKHGSPIPPQVTSPALRDG